MKEFWARLDPPQRRIVVIGLSLLFLLINYVFVWPHFSDWSRLQNDLLSNSRTLVTRQALIAQSPALKGQEEKLKNEGADVPQDDQAFQFVRAIQTQAGQSGVRIVNQGSTRQVGTNQFFLEQSQTITVQSDEKQLVDFLYGLGAGKSLVRVRALSVQPDPSHQSLNSQVTLVASFQKTPAKAAAPVARPAPAAAAPAAIPNPAPAPAPVPRPALPVPGTPRPPPTQKP